jgi:single-stranded-DNA-specific exonuclease
MHETDANLPLMAQTLGVSEICARLMACRGIRSRNAALAYLQPSLSRLCDAAQMKDSVEAIVCIQSAIAENQHITVYGDYDADGIMATVITMKALRHLGADASYYIPHRMEEGYGLNSAAVQELSNRGTQLIICVDNGIAAIQEIELAQALGMQVVIIDHHEPGFTATHDDILPPAIIVDPKQAACLYPYKEMCAAGLAFRMATALCEAAGAPLSQDTHDELLVLAAIATLCDIVDLTGENRILVACGLEILNKNKLVNAGLGSLITVRGYLEKYIGGFEVGYIIGPCLNASGRLESASVAVDLLLDPPEKPSDRLAAAYALLQLNEARKNLTAQCVQRMESSIPEPLPAVIVLVDNDAHESVAGIVAGRIREKTGRPTIVLTPGEGQLKGSARSVAGFDFFAALHTNRHLFTRFGGHAMAAGLTMPAANIEALRTALNAACTMENFEQAVEVDCELQPAEISPALVREIARLSPFGKANAEPLFITRGFTAEKVRVLDEKNTLIFTLTHGGFRFKGIAFGLNEQYAAAIQAANAPPLGGYTLDISYTLEENHWNGATELQARIKGFWICEGG